MSHYDSCRPGYCGCGAGPGNFIGGLCQFCYPVAKRGNRSEVAPLMEPSPRFVGAFIGFKNRVQQIEEFVESAGIDDNAKIAALERQIAKLKRIKELQAELAKLKGGR